jgi:nitrogen fixation protein NifX
LDMPISTSESVSAKPQDIGGASKEPGQARTVRIAAASVDGKFVHSHFGKTTHFQVFDLTGDTLRFVETRRVEPACGPEGHDDQRLRATLELLGDTQVVLVAAIGPGAVAALSARGVRAFEVQDYILNAVCSVQRALAQSRLSFEIEETRRNHS